VEKHYDFYINRGSSILSFSIANNFRNITVRRIIKRFEDGWNPSQDNQWREWRDSLT
jgi:hypothetical protein